MPDLKFSQFADGGMPNSGDIVVGLRDGLNTKFTLNFTEGAATIIAASPSTLTNPLKNFYTVLLVSNKTIALPVADLPTTSLTPGQPIYFYSSPTHVGILTLTDSSAGFVVEILPGQLVQLVLVDNGSEPGSWRAAIINEPGNHGFLSLNDATPTGLTNPMSTFYRFVGSADKTFTLPDMQESAVDIITPGETIFVNNLSDAGVLTIQTSAAGWLATVYPGTTYAFTLTGISDSSGSWTIAKMGTLPNVKFLAYAASGYSYSAGKCVRITGHKDFGNNFPGQVVPIVSGIAANEQPDGIFGETYGEGADAYCEVFTDAVLLVQVAGTEGPIGCPIYMTSTGTLSFTPARYQVGRYIDDYVTPGNYYVHFQIDSGITGNGQFSFSTIANATDAQLTNPVSTYYNYNLTSADKTFKMPDVQGQNSVQIGQTIYKSNHSVKYVATINDFGNAFLATLYPGQTLAFTLTSVSTTSGSWYIQPISITPSTANLAYAKSGMLYSSGFAYKAVDVKASGNAVFGSDTVVIDTITALADVPVGVGGNAFGNDDDAFIPLQQQGVYTVSVSGSASVGQKIFIDTAGGGSFTTTATPFLLGTMVATTGTPGIYKVYVNIQNAANGCTVNFASIAANLSVAQAATLHTEGTSILGATSEIANGSMTTNTVNPFITNGASNEADIVNVKWLDNSSVNGKIINQLDNFGYTNGSFPATNIVAYFGGSYLGGANTHAYVNFVLPYNFSQLKNVSSVILYGYNQNNGSSNFNMSIESIWGPPNTLTLDSASASFSVATPGDGTLFSLDITSLYSGKTLVPGYMMFIRCIYPGGWPGLVLMTNYSLQYRLYPFS